MRVNTKGANGAEGGQGQWALGERTVDNLEDRLADIIQAIDVPLTIVERVFRSFVDDRQPGERFATWALRAQEDLLV